ncbi:MAG: hypothetical protein K9M82_12655 [Deltaproteobacteria bacterium]|nr:hypothetical protein [Deltaproteobacteria bacterium]
MFDFFGLCVQGVFYDKNNIPIGELGLIPDFKTPDVIYGLDTPIGGISTLLPFGSGGLSITNYQSPSYNIPLGPGVNSKFYISIKEGVISEGPTISTPILEGRFTLDTTLRLNAKLGGAKVNFPVGYGANAYIGLEW